MKLAATILATVLAVPQLFADAVELKTGERVEGIFKQAGPMGVVIEVAGQPLKIPLAKVRAIYLGAAPAATAAGPKDLPLEDSLTALKGLESVTKTGVAYRDYAPRVLDAKVKVDRYLGSAPAGKLHAAIGQAMRCYELASQAWNAKIRKDYSQSANVGESILSETGLRDCPGVSWLVETERSASKIGSDVGEEPSLLWSCASARIAEADKLIRPQAGAAKAPKSSK